MWLDGVSRFPILKALPNTDEQAQQALGDNAPVSPQHVTAPSLPAALHPLIGPQAFAVTLRLISYPSLTLFDAWPWEVWVLD